MSGRLQLLQASSHPNTWGTVFSHPPVGMLMGSPRTGYWPITGPTALLTLGPMCSAPRVPGIVCERVLSPTTPLSSGVITGLISRGDQRSSSSDLSETKKLRTCSAQSDCLQSLPFLLTPCCATAMQIQDKRVNSCHHTPGQGP